ncbi:unnamed protein product [Nesidiocoris tenuis]|uniref:Uncharacterized protein n=1 Tax=Nesidiocoris tenuis TaxID=355587 RepID=A0A6H5H8B7_9HEMI|nr:unnamed protein product [Nesidiocoris tenuis]
MSEDQPTPPDVYGLLRLWDDEHGQPNYDPIPHLTAMAEIIEAESEAFMKMDPDPFDERHPSRAYPNSTLGYTLKVLFRKEQFMNKLVNDYMRDNYYSRLGIQRDVRKLNIAACRLMLDITPGLETSAVFEMPTNDALIQRLFAWAENSVEPLQTYATGLLAAAMDVQEIAVVFSVTSCHGDYWLITNFLSSVFENNALDLIMELINLRTTKHARLSFEALKYLASLLCHKKFSIEFITVQGLQRLLEVPRPSIAATGVSICLYYLAYCEDAMERVCLLPQHVLSDLVRYALWLLECSHDSGRCHATMFFGLSFQFQVILEEFDAQDGLRKLYNVISTLPILTDDSPPMNDDEECSARQIVRQVSVALKRYLEAHLYIRSEQVRRAHLRDISSEKMHSPTLPSYKACRSSPEQVREQINTLLEFMSFKASWAPVDEFLRLGGINLLLTVIAFAYDWNYSGRGETVRSSLDVLGICSVMPKVQMQLCEKVGLPEDPNAVGINVILSAAEGEIVSDPDVQRSALQVLITIVCAPIFRVGGSVVRFSSSVSTKKKTRSSEEVVEKMWDCVRTSNGVMVLLALIQLKAPLTDADSVRSLACQAMAGLARSETVRQIIGKLPLFTTGQLQSLMKDPIRPDRRQEHALFQKYAMELLERVSGKTKPRSELEPTLSNIHRASVIAQTRIQFNDRDLLQVIQQHLLSHGMTESAEVLGKEAGLPPVRTVPPPLPAFHSSFNSQRSNSTPTREVSSYHCHESYISHLMSARKSPLLLTSSTWRQPLSACWSIKDNIFHPIYDIETKALLQTLKPSISNQYTKNKATFSPNNELVLSDGVLWDVNSGKHIHKLDKLNQSISGVFHPNGVEIVSNTEVWDLRTFHLLRTVPTLDQSDILFDPTGYTIFSVACDNDNEVDTTFDNSFKTLDAYDYSSIATIDVKKNIHDFACNGKDTQIAIVENQGTLFDSMQESIVKIYDIGRLRITDDDVEEEDDDDDMEASEGSNTDDDQQNDDTLPMEIFDDTDDDTTFDGGQSDSSSSTTTGMIEFG